MMNQVRQEIIGWVIRNIAALSIDHVFRYLRQ